MRVRSGVGFKASLSYTATDLGPEPIANLAVLPNVIGTGGLSINQRNVANALDNFFNNGGALPPGLPPNLRSPRQQPRQALSELSGEAATGGQQGAFQMGNPRAEADPLSTAARRRRARRAGNASRPSAKPCRRNRAGLCRDAQGAAGEGAKLRAALERAGRRLWRQQSHVRRPAVVGSHDLSARRAGFAGGLDYRIAPNTVVGIALVGGGTNLEPCQWSRQRQERCPLPASTASRVGPGLPGGGLRLQCILADNATAVRNFFVHPQQGPCGVDFFMPNALNAPRFQNRT